MFVYFKHKLTDTMWITSLFPLKKIPTVLFIQQGRANSAVEVIKRRFRARVTLFLCWQITCHPVQDIPIKYDDLSVNVMTHCCVISSSWCTCRCRHVYSVLHVERIVNACAGSQKTRSKKIIYCFCGFLAQIWCDTGYSRAFWVCGIPATSGAGVMHECHSFAGRIVNSVVKKIQK